MLTSANVWSTVFIHLGTILAAVAYFVVGNAMLPNVTARGAQRLAVRPKTTILVGLLVSAPWVALSLAMLSRGGAVAFVGALIGLAWILLGLIGGAAVARHIGQVGEDWKRVARGGTVLTLTWVLPLIGWFVMLPLTLATGVGCMLLSGRRSHAQPA